MDSMTGNNLDMSNKSRTTTTVETWTLDQKIKLRDEMRDGYRAVDHYFEIFSPEEELPDWLNSYMGLVNRLTNEIIRAK